MKITVTRRGLKLNEIFFTSPHGEGRGLWNGPPIVPAQTAEVEFEVTQLLMRWVDIVPAEGQAEAGIALDGERVVFTGRLEDIDEEGTGYLRIGEGLLMFESLGEPMMLGSLVSVFVREPAIYPVVL